MRRLIFLIPATLLLLSCASLKVDRGPDGTKLIADTKPVAVAKVGVGLEQLFTSVLFRGDVTVMFVPRTNGVTLNFNFQTLKNELYLSERARTAVIAAIGQYQKDFDARSLNVGMSKKMTRDAYGTEDVSLKWGLLAPVSEARPEVMLGYIFIDRSSPYFTVFIPKTDNINGQTDSNSSNNYSIETVLYFTKAQAAALGQALMQETLVAAIDPVDLPGAESKPDEYKTK